jgi:hypothetical protein
VGSSLNSISRLANLLFCLDALGIKSVIGAGGYLL